MTRYTNRPDRSPRRVWKLAAALAGLTMGLSTSVIEPQAAPMPLEVVPHLDLARYAGTWYEIARLPNEFQRHCTGDVTATYSVRDDGRLDVVNRCRTATGMDDVSGVARRVEGRPPSVLEVRFAPAISSALSSAWGDYQVIALSPTYTWAVVGTPDRQTLWILSRTPTLEDAIYERLTSEVSRQGFDVGQLIRTPQSRSASR